MRAERKMHLGMMAGVAALLLASVAGVEAADQARAVSFEIISPAANATVSSPVKIELKISGATIGRPADGLDHVHVGVDDARPKSIYEPGPITLELAPGEHKVMVEVAGPNHRALLPAKYVSFTVE